MEGSVYQKNFSTNHNVLFNLEERRKKAKNIITVLNDYFQGDLKVLKKLDIGSYTMVGS